jgi:NAD(P)-dependent dehydrogenase (short-subunit alcohol dehydrogenase family)
MTSPVVLVTGALTGIGRATAESFARLGATVAVAGRHQDAGEALSVELESLGAKSAAFVKADVRYENEVRALVDQVIERFGRLDVAVNNAGSDGTMGDIVDQTPETYAATFDTNVLGTLQTAMLDRVTGNNADTKAAFLSLVPQGRAGDVPEIADAIAFITSERAGFLTGQTIFIDGGVTAA